MGRAGRPAGRPAPPHVRGPRGRPSEGPGGRPPRGPSEMACGLWPVTTSFGQGLCLEPFVMAPGQDLEPVAQDRLPVNCLLHAAFGYDLLPMYDGICPVVCDLWAWAAACDLRHQTA